MVNSRRKGRDAQAEFGNLLRDRDWEVDDTRAGMEIEDIIAIDPNGCTWSVEVKSTRNIYVGHIEQARRQAKKRKLPWMLSNKIFGSKYWLVRRQGESPVLWK